MALLRHMACSTDALSELLNRLRRRSVSNAGKCHCMIPGQPAFPCRAGWRFRRCCLPLDSGPWPGCGRPVLTDCSFLRPDPRLFTIGQSRRRNCHCICHRSRHSQARFPESCDQGAPPAACQALRIPWEVAKFRRRPVGLQCNRPSWRWFSAQRSSPNKSRASHLSTSNRQGLVRHAPCHMYS